MPEFLHLVSPQEAMTIFMGAMGEKPVQTEELDVRLALGRILGEDILALVGLPEFSRSAMDGYAVVGSDTHGASESQPGYLTVAGEVLMGSGDGPRVAPGTCVLIHTGGKIPLGADAVIMLENTRSLVQPAQSSGRHQASEIEIYKPVGVGENILVEGEEVGKGRLVLEKGTRVRPVDIGGCMALGITRVRVVNKPVVGIISTGDELVPPEVITSGGRVRDVNSYSLAAQVEEMGGRPVLYGIVPDQIEALGAVALKAFIESDVVIITAGSSASARDTTDQVIASLGDPGVLVHGINIRPGKPTILAVCGGKPVIGLPGNPVSATVIASLFVEKVLDKLMHAKVRQKSRIRAAMRMNVASQAGREDWVAVKLVEEIDASGEQRIVAEPVFGKSNYIFSLVAADGLVRILAEQTGVASGEEVEVTLWR